MPAPRTPDPGVDNPLTGILPGGKAVAAGAKSVAESVTGGASSVVAGVGDVTDSVRAVRRWISDRHNWTRVAWFLSGSACFVVGVLMVGQRPASQAVSTVAKAAGPVGKVLK